MFHWSLHLLLNRTPKKSLLFFLQCLIGSDSQTKRNFQVKSEMAPPRLKNKVICQRSGHSLHPVKQNTAICDVCQEEKDIRITKADGTFGDPNPQLKIHHEKHKAVAGAATSITGVPTSIVETPTSIVETPTSIFIFIVLVAFVVVQHSALSDYGRDSRQRKVRQRKVRQATLSLTRSAISSQRRDWRCIDTCSRFRRLKIVRTAAFWTR